MGFTLNELLVVMAANTNCGGVYRVFRCPSDNGALAGLWEFDVRFTI